MLPLHLDHQLLDAVFGGRIPPDTLLPRVLGHLLDLCPVCEAAFNAWQADAADAPPADFDALFRRAADFARSAADRVDEERRAAPALLSSLLSHAPSERLNAVHADPARFRGALLAEELIDRSYGCVGSSSAEAFALAQLAKAVLRHSDLSSAVIELYARAMVHMGNALRVSGMLTEAAESFDDARFLLRSTETGDRLVAAEFDRLEGMLRKDQRRFPEAEKLLQQAVVAYRLTDRLEETAITTLNLGLLYHETGQPEEAADAALRVLALVSAERYPKLVRFARHNLALALCGSDRYREAHEIVVRNRAAFDEARDPIEHLRVCWLEGMIAAGLGDAASAESLLTSARGGFRDAGLAYDVALVSLDLAKLYLEDGRTGDVKQLAAGMVAVFADKQVHREAFAAMTLFRDAVHIERVSAAVIQEFVTYLTRARYDPSYAFAIPS